MDHTKKSLTALSLCTGMRGLDKGIERGIAALRNPRGYRSEQDWRDQCSAAVRYAAYVEIEAFAALNLVEQMEQGVLAPTPVWTDLKTFPWEYFYKKIHILSGGYPCQPFSQAGLQNGVDDPRHLFPFIEHGVDATRPVLLFFENVANHVNLGFSEVRRRISRLGYKVEADIFAAEQVGAPHLRKRLFIMAVADTYCNEQSKRRGDLAEMFGVPKGGQQEFGASLSGGNGSSVGNANVPGSQGKNGVREPTMPAQSSMGDANFEGQQQHPWLLDESGGWPSHPGEDAVDNATGRRHSAEDAIRARGNGTPGSGPAMDDSLIKGLERHGWHGHSRTRWTNTVRSIAETSIWPAGQGREQYGWESPRLESSVGCTINGYNYQEDLLRMEGNAVVEQQAELAFRTLIQKFI